MASVGGLQFSLWNHHNNLIFHLLSPPPGMGFPGSSAVKVSACNTGDPGSIPGLGRSPGEGNGNPLQYSCLENPMDGGAWWAIVHGVTKRWTWLMQLGNTCCSASWELTIKWKSWREEPFKTHLKGSGDLEPQVEKQWSKTIRRNKIFS